LVKTYVIENHAKKINKEETVSQEPDKREIAFPQTNSFPEQPETDEPESGNENDRGESEIKPIPGSRDEWSVTWP